MKLWRLGIAIAVLGPIATAAHAGQTGTGRLAQIWSYVDARMDQQQDVWFDEGDFPVTIQLLRISSESRPSNYDTWTNLGWMLENVEDWDAAVQIYSRYRDQNPKDPDRALPLGDYYARKREYAPIPAILEPYVHHKPTPHPNLYRILARAYERLGKFQDSKRVWQVYIAASPNDLAAKANLKRVEKKIASPSAPAPKAR